MMSKSGPGLVLINVSNKARRRWFACSASRLILPPVVVTVLVLLTIAVLAQPSNLETVLGMTEAWLAGHRDWGIIVFILVSTISMLVVIPEAIFGIAAGSLFGFVWGSISLCVSGLLCAVLVFLVARSFLQRPVQHLLSCYPRIQAIEEVVNAGGLRLLCLLRLLPVNATIMSYALAMTKVRLWPYLVASCCMIPAWILTVYFGCVAADMVKVTGGTSEFAPLRDTLAVVGLVVSIMVMVYIGRLAARRCGADRGLE